MLLTPNYNLKKPEETDPIDILDLNDNADIIDAEFKKRPVASGGDVSEMTVKTLETTTTEFPVPVAGESTKTFLGKVKKFFEDTKNWMTGVCLIGQIVNNCVTDNAKLPLSAAQGKALMDLYTVLNTNYEMLTKIINVEQQDITTACDTFKNGIRIFSAGPSNYLFPTNHVYIGIILKISDNTIRIIAYRSDNNIERPYYKIKSGGVWDSHWFQ